MNFRNSGKSSGDNVTRPVNGSVQNYERVRARMIERLRHEYRIRDERVLAAMNEIPRHLFVPQAFQGSAYGDHALPIAASQTISQPYIVARQSELLELRPDDKVLEIGAGSGYQTAVLSKLVRSIFAIERILELARNAQTVLRQLDIRNVILKSFDGTNGWSDYAPYRAILVAAGSPEIPQPLVEQLDLGGRLIIPIGTEQEQRLTRVTRTATGTKIEDFGPCQFVKLIGQHGWNR